MGLRGPRGPYEPRDTIICVWCGEHHEVVRREAQTCGDKCRSRLARFRAVTGFDPNQPPGDVGAKVALDELVAMLIAAERVRRIRAAAGDRTAKETDPELARRGY